MRHGYTLAVAALVAIAAPGCKRGFSDDDAKQVVRAYLDHVVEAYRKGEVWSVLPYVGPEHGKKLTGLIGVKSDQGIFLDSKLLEIQFREVRRARDGGDAFDVFTTERWYYLDRKVGTGEQVGQDSTDSYQLRYRIGKDEGKWVVLETEFTSSPVVGRKEAPVTVDARTLHGMIETRVPEEAKPAQPGPAPGAAPLPGPVQLPPHPQKK